MARPASLSNSVYEQIRQSIATGEFPKGFKLPTESTLCQRYHVSRPVVRTAMERLREDGVINTIRGSGSFVLQGQEAGHEVKPAAVDFTITNIGDIMQCQETRMAFEGEMAALAAERWRSSDLEAIRSAMQTIRSCGVESGGDVDADLRFHRAIVKASHNRYALTLYETMLPQITLGMSISSGLYTALPEFAQRHGLQEHEAILEAIEARDATQAREAMRRHISFTNDSIQGRD
ncbi:FadR/GntR family transcriptional regulator [Polycladidibacter hongkongensis]|uniref:FadR/GntR family transcriptional regulator n=1 Tax=Polycladidibacter hongkongensis TaxID=1647556 RepID=UPI00082BE969|nr:FadR/GntR family transcriptional regulator [Pseudovibrio hongkongensis]